MPAQTRLQSKAVMDLSPPITEGYLFGVLDVLEGLARESGHSIPQIALAWLLTRPTVSTLIVGARDEKQLQENLKCLEVRLGEEELRKLDAVSATPKAYPYWHQADFKERNPFPA
jgi:aryl-alcohol dehydrogenase-like predicted oxidoreductase